MQVILSGHSIDIQYIKDLKAGRLRQDATITPETISAAYARISRYPEPVPALRAKARQDVEKARKSNRIIVFQMGHHSVAEHVQLNFDILGISRLALEALEDSRLCSYTEKSQRYITLEGDYVVPDELDEVQRRLLHTTVNRQVQFYREAFAVLHDYQMRLHPEMSRSKRERDVVEGWAKEDARYCLALATEAQLGFSANARNVEYIIRKLRYHELAEVRTLSHLLFDAASEVAPSLIVLSDPEKFYGAFGRRVSDDYYRYFYRKSPTINSVCKDLMPLGSSDGLLRSGRFGYVKLVDYTPEPDVKIAAALVASSSSSCIDACLGEVRRLREQSPDKFKELVLSPFEHACEYDPAPREFEFASFTFEAVISASCFAQLKRHRMMSILKQNYDPSYGITIPASIEETGLDKGLAEVAEASEESFYRVEKTRGTGVASYFLTNGHRRRVVVNCNLRQLYHMARLRMDPHAQWDIRLLTSSMVELAGCVCPVASALACGKGGYGEKKAAIFGARGVEVQSAGALKYAELPEQEEK